MTDSAPVNRPGPPPARPGPAQDTAKARNAAARLARQLAAQEPGTRVASREKIAASLGIHPSTAQRARILLQGAGIICKSGRHLYVSPRPVQPPPDTDEPGANDLAPGPPAFPPS